MKINGIELTAKRTAVLKCIAEGRDIGRNPITASLATMGLIEIKRSSCRLTGAGLEALEQIEEKSND
jgi:hypothetical protein